MLLATKTATKCTMTTTTTLWEEIEHHSTPLPCDNGAMTYNRELWINDQK